MITNLGHSDMKIRRIGGVGNILQYM